MAALKAAGADRKKIVRKRKSSEGDKQESGPNKISKADSSKESSDEGTKKEEELAVPLKSTGDHESLGIKAEEKQDAESAPQPPASVKPALNVSFMLRNC